MSANAKCGDSLINLAVLLIAMTATGMSTVKVQKQDKDAEAYRLASEYAMQERWKDVVELCQRHLRDKPNDAEMISVLGIAYSELGSHQESLDAWFNLGAAYEKQERFEEEIDACLQAIKLKPDWAEAHCNLGVALSKLSRWAEAVEAFKQAVKIKSGYAEAHFNLGVACLNLGDQKAAKVAYETLKTLDADLAGRLLKLISQ